MSIHRSGLLAASRVVSRAPGPNETPGETVVGERLGERRRDRLRQVAGPGELPVVRLGVDEHGLGLEHLAPRSRITRRAAVSPPGAPVSQT